MADVTPWTLVVACPMNHQLHATLDDITHLWRGGKLTCPKCDRIAEAALKNADLDAEFLGRDQR